LHSSLNQGVLGPLGLDEDLGMLSFAHCTKRVEKVKVGSSALRISEVIFSEVKKRNRSQFALENFQ
jgi:hypothetical protein